MVLLFSLFANHGFAQPALGSESSNVGLKFIEDIELTPRNINQKTIWRHGGTITYSTGSETDSKHEKEYKNDIENFELFSFKYAMMMDIPVESLQWDACWFDFLERWIGTPYQFGGNSIHGTDCSGFTANLYNYLFGIELARTSREQARQCSFISQDSLHLGDLVFFRNGFFISHVGVYLSNGYFVHASTSQGVTISNLSETYFKKRFYRAGRIYLDFNSANLESKAQDAP